MNSVGITLEYLPTLLKIVDMINTSRQMRQVVRIYCKQ